MVAGLLHAAAACCCCVGCLALDGIARIRNKRKIVKEWRGKESGEN
jgi:hypothetical protein